MLINFKNHSYKFVLNEWLNIKKNTIKISTYQKYEFIINNYILIYFQKKKFKNINNDDIIYFFNSKNIINLSNYTKNLIFNIINSSILYGIDNGYHKKIDIVYLDFKTKSTNIEYLTTIEQEILEKYIKGNMNIRNLSILISLYSGIRLGELCSLKGEDIDFINNTISIKRTVKRIKDNNTSKTKLVIDKPKTNNSIRTIPIPKFVTNILKKYINDNDNYIFTNSSNPKDPRTVEKYFNNLLIKLNIRHLKFHSLRHTYATRLREQKVDIKVISELLGHANWKITQDIYVHASFEYKEKSVNEIAKNWKKIGS